MIKPSQIVIDFKQNQNDVLRHKLTLFRVLLN